MTETTHVATPPGGPHATDLAVLVELEARWENLRRSPARTADVRSTTRDLQGIQKAYEAFRARLAAFNKEHRPGHTPELLLNTAGRLRLWCWKMRDLFARVENDSGTPCPVNILEKAYRCADAIAARTGSDCPARPAAASDVAGAVRELAALGAWCDARLNLQAA